MIAKNNFYVYRTIRELIHGKPLQDRNHFVAVGHTDLQAS